MQSNTPPLLALCGGEACSPADSTRGSRGHRSSAGRVGRPLPTCSCGSPSGTSLSQELSSHIRLAASALRRAVSDLSAAAAAAAGSCPRAAACAAASSCTSRLEICGGGPAGCALRCNCAKRSHLETQEGGREGRILTRHHRWPVGQQEKGLARAPYSPSKPWAACMRARLAPFCV